MRLAWRPDETDTLKKLLAQKLTVEEIAKRMKRPPGSIKTRIHVDKLRPEILGRGQWSDADLSMALDMREKKIPFKQIEKATGRSRQAIQKKLKTLDGEYLRKRAALQKARSAVIPLAQPDWFEKKIDKARLMGRI